MIDAYYYAMAKAVLYIKDRVQDVGYRVFVMERLLETQLKGGAVNTEDGEVKVLLEGSHKDIVAFVERLKREMPELAENPVMVGPVFDETLEVPDEIRVSHSLQMNQFGKAVGYLAGMDKKLDAGFDRLEKKFDEFGIGLGSKIDELPRKISDELGKRFDELPYKIAEAMKGNGSDQNRCSPKSRM